MFSYTNHLISFNSHNLATAKKMTEAKENMVYHAIVFMSLAISASQKRNFIPASISRLFTNPHLWAPH
jgi:hypothetical protein